jgi:hypothetical protein
MRVAWMAAWALVCVALSSCGDDKAASAPCDLDHDDCPLPADAWEVRFVPSAHYAEPYLMVTIHDDFAWPVASGQPVSYHVRWIPELGTPLDDVAVITSGERFAVVAIQPPAFMSELGLTPDEAEAAYQAEQAALTDAANRLAEGGTVDDAVIDGILNARDIGVDLDERALVAGASIVLIPFAGDRGLARQEKTDTRKTRYTWGLVETRDGDPCKGKKPEDCARDKLKKLRDDVCNAKGADQKPRFPDQCARLTAMLAKDPSEPLVVCAIPADKGVTAAATDLDTGVITLHGDEFLTGTCPTATLMHELQHVIDGAAGRAPNVAKLRAAEKKLAQAKKDKAAATTDAARQDAARREAEAIITIMQLERMAGLEMLDLEHRALFALLDNADFYGYPGAGLAWAKATVKDMVGELSSIRGMFKLPLKTQALCDCMKKISDWVKAHPDVKANFDEDVFGTNDDGPVTTSQVIDGLVIVYCP